MALALSLAVFYELFWLDLFPAGTYIPPNGLFSMFCILALSPNLRPTDATTYFLPVMLTLPLAFLGSLLEKKHREWQASGYNRLLLRFRTADDLGSAAAMSAGISLTELFIINFTVFFGATCGVVFLFGFLSQWHGRPLVFPHASWPLLWAVGGVGGVLALRTTQSRTVFIAGSMVVCVLAFFGFVL
ncbi:MAG: hypothetical protein DELT_02134 [Desulfovibrio sp.]